MIPTPETWISAEALRVHDLFFPTPDYAEYFQQQLKNWADKKREEAGESAPFDEQRAREMGAQYAAPILSGTDRSALPYDLADYSRLLEQTDKRATQTAKANASDRYRHWLADHHAWVARARKIRAEYLEGA